MKSLTYKDSILFLFNIPAICRDILLRPKSRNRISFRRLL